MHGEIYLQLTPFERRDRPGSVKSLYFTFKRRLFSRNRFQEAVQLLVVRTGLSFKMT